MISWPSLTRGDALAFALALALIALGAYGLQCEPKAAAVPPRGPLERKLGACMAACTRRIRAGHSECSEACAREFAYAVFQGAGE